MFIGPGSLFVKAQRPTVTGPAEYNEHDRNSELHMLREE
jgi:hypothetical protein